MKEYGKICNHPVSYKEACYLQVRARNEDIVEAQRVLYDLASRCHIEYHGAQLGTGELNGIFGYLEGHRPTLIDIRRRLEKMGWKFSPRL